MTKTTVILNPIAGRGGGSRLGPHISAWLRGYGLDFELETTATGRLRMVGFVPQFMRGSHTTDPNVTMVRGQKVTVSSESPWATQVDGEIYGVGGRHFETELLPQRLRLLCGSACK